MHETNIIYYSRDLDEEIELSIGFDYEPYDPGDRETPPVDESFSINKVEIEEDVMNGIVASEELKTEVNNLCWISLENEYIDDLKIKVETHRSNIINTN